MKTKSSTTATIQTAERVAREAVRHLHGEDEVARRILVDERRDMALVAARLESRPSARRGLSVRALNRLAGVVFQ